ncbi:DUF58 domain-containing protein [Piscinibacter sp. HJYY11]|uniref:DUF58 domain-containing protein n=1 Tax=Piscinibacter sp. HJYY11 TaxID=2801333 RepID=UPI00191E880F|nr:DUF58 domain-containing protein [Piscinibacter sp. HJYY11]MBL0727087.1 DUF58 domain-containing protein [Piscinibacter sp. HJYY11]
MSSIAAPLRSVLHPAAAVRRRFRAWWQARLPRTDTLLLTQRNIYILPTRAGLMFGVTLVVLLLASINYQLSLGYVLTFLLAGSGIVSMHVTHNTLRGLTLHLRPPSAVFAGTSALLDVTLTSAGRARFGIGLSLESTPGKAVAWTDVPEGGQSSAQVSFVPPQRGRHDVPTIQIETRFPLGLFRAWAIWRPAAQVLVYPRLEQPAAPLPAAHPVPGGPAARRSTDGGEVEGVRSYRRGDPLKMVLWKKAARTLETTGELVSRDTSASVQHQLWLDWSHCTGLAPEDRLSRLATWVVAANRAGADHGLRLPGVEIAPGQGEAQRKECLEALALWS